MKKKNLTALTFPIITLLLECLPNGVIMRFATPPGEPPVIQKTSYFDLLPMGYANFAPLLTAILTIVLLVVMVLYAVKSRPKLLKIGKILSLTAAIISLCPMIFSSYSLIGGAVSVSLFAEFLYLTRKN